MPPKKIKEIKLYDDHYKADICFLHGGSADDFIFLINQRHPEQRMYSWDTVFEFGEDANTTDAYQFHINAVHGDGEKFYLWMLEVIPSLFFHEIYHLSGDILYTRGIEYCFQSEEAYAYYGAWIFEKIYTAIGGKLKL